MHFAQFLIVLGMNEATFKRIPRDVIFVSSTLNLTLPIQMVHDPAAPPTQCTDALDAIRARPPSSLLDVVVKDAGGAVLFDLSQKSIVEFHHPGQSINVPSMIMLFFLLSWAFQLYNGDYLASLSSGPHHVQYIEYSFSASLTLVIMALNTGILDLLTILSTFALFFGMNMFGAVAEYMMHLAETFGDKADGCRIIGPVTLARAWIVPHLCGWVLFFFAWVPIIVKFYRIEFCSENKQGAGVPWFIELAVVVESTCYFLFGIVQLVVLLGRTWNLGDSPAGEWWKKCLDVCTISLSLIAKSFLAWALLGPAYTWKG
jgi:hypothetical protein